jgi:hypothetical protein
MAGNILPLRRTVHGDLLVAVGTGIFCRRPGGSLDRLGGGVSAGRPAVNLYGAAAIAQWVVSVECLEKKQVKITAARAGCR